MHDEQGTTPPPEHPAASQSVMLSAHGSLLDVRLWLLVAAFIAIGILSLNDTMLYTPDCPRYLIWAKSLAAFEGFKDTSNPDPTQYVVHAPFYPLLLAPLAWFFSNIIVPAKFVTLLFGAALIVLFYYWASKWAGRRAALVGVFFLALNPLTLLFSTHVLSDIPFTVFIILFFLVAEKMAEVPEGEKWGGCSFWSSRWGSSCGKSD